MKLYGLLGKTLKHSFSNVGFDVYYKVENNEDADIVATARTGMVCYNYQQKKVSRVPQIALAKFSGH